MAGRSTTPEQEVSIVGLATARGLGWLTCGSSRSNSCSAGLQTGLAQVSLIQESRLTRVPNVLYQITLPDASERATGRLLTV